MRYPALDVHGVDADIALATALDYSPIGAEHHDQGITLFFASASNRELAREAITGTLPQAWFATVDVDDGDWARRSQAQLKPVAVGRITIVPAYLDPSIAAPQPEPPAATSFGGTFNCARPQSAIRACTIAIAPSMGFGTGHHATTRLCLIALQQLDLSRRFVVDVGTGSGILAIAARRLGAARALGLDNDPDAIAAASDNLRLNRDSDNVQFEVADLTSTIMPTGDVVIANLTGALLARAAARLTQAVTAGGTLIVGGLLETEENAVRSAFGGFTLVGRSQEEEWVCLTFERL